MAAEKGGGVDMQDVEDALKPVEEPEKMGEAEDAMPEKPEKPKAKGKAKAKAEKPKAKGKAKTRKERVQEILDDADSKEKEVVVVPGEGEAGDAIKTLTGPSRSYKNNIR